VRFELEHPDEPGVKAVYDHDRMIGFFVEIRVHEKPLLAYDNTRSGYRQLQGAINLLVEAEFFSREDVADAHQWLRCLVHEEMPDEDTRRAAEVIENLRRAAAE
jgi:hypothetical protein